MYFMKRAKKGTIGKNEIGFKMPPELYEEVRALANELYFGNMSMLVRMALKEFIAKKKLELSTKAQAPKPESPNLVLGGERSRDLGGDRP